MVPRQRVSAVPARERLDERDPWGRPSQYAAVAGSGGPDRRVGESGRVAIAGSLSYGRISTGMRSNIVDP
jgi:hypothetical protein